MGEEHAAVTSATARYGRGADGATIGHSSRWRFNLLGLVVVNVVPIALAYAGYAWPYAPLVYCAGNALAIVQGSRGYGAAKDLTVADTWLRCLLMTFGALGWAWLAVPLGTLDVGLSWDGRQYAALYSYFSSGAFHPITPTFPYTQRVAVPFLAAHLPLDARDAFLLLHAVFWSGTMAIFAVCCRTAFRLRSRTIQFGVLWLQILWFSIPRAVAGCAFVIDSATAFFIQLWIFLLLAGSRRKPWLPLVAFVGVLFKETVLLIVVLCSCGLLLMRIAPTARRLLPADWIDLKGTPWRMLWTACLSGTAAKWMTTHVVPAGHRGSELDTILHWISLRLQDPSQPLRYVAATFSVYGGFALIRMATLRKPPIREPGWPVTLLTIVGPLYLAVCFVSGSDLTRFAFLAFPFVLPLLLVEFEEVSAQFAFLGLLLGLPAAHAFTQTPPPFHELPSQDLQGVFSWMMEYAHFTIVGSWMAWWLGCVLLLRSVGFSGTWRQELLPETPASDRARVDAHRRGGGH